MNHSILETVSEWFGLGISKGLDRPNPRTWESKTWYDRSPWSVVYNRILDVSERNPREGEQTRFIGVSSKNFFLKGDDDKKNKK